MIRSKILSRVGLSIALAGLLSSCASVNETRDQRRASMGVIPGTGELGDASGMDPLAAAAFWGTRFDQYPADPVAATRYSQALRTLGQAPEALRVMQLASQRMGDNSNVQLELGKALLANDRGHEAVRPISTALALGASEDWTAYSALGVAFDQMGDHKGARRQYDKALALAPNQPQVLNNKGLSYALEGNQAMAERTLSYATSGPGGTARIRQNYALVLALGGKTVEAERLARADLPPQMADNNVAYYRSLMAQPVYWQPLDGADIVQPDFGDLPATSTAPIAVPVPDGPGEGPVRLRQEREQRENTVPPVDQDGPIRGEPAPGVSASAEDARSDEDIVLAATAQ